MPALPLPPGSVLPRYGSDCISGIAPAVMRLLGAETSSQGPPPSAFGGLDLSGVDRVVLLVADGFGITEWRRQEASGLVADFARGGQVREITTVFPSTTAAALTSIATGLTPQEHGLLEWFLYMKEVDAVVTTLPFSFVGDSGRETLRGKMSPSALFSGTPLFRTLNDSGVTTHSFTSGALANTTYTTLVHGESRIATFSGASDMTAGLRRAVESARGPSFFHVYWSRIDSIEHEFGPDTHEAELEAALLSFVMHAGFVTKLDREAAKRTLLVVTADHGQVGVNFGETFYLNTLGALKKMFRKSGGRRITPAGGPRDVLLYLEPDSVDEAFGLLGEKLAGRATILKTEDAIKAGLFGLHRPSGRFRERAGDLLILPHGNGTVWYREEPGYRLDMRGHHGGLSRGEMVVPLAFGRVSELQGRMR